MRILGVDPGFGIVGFGVIEWTGREFEYVDSGVIRTHKGLPFGERLKEIDSDFAKLVSSYDPEVCALEKLYFARNTTTAMKVAEARGVLVLGASKAGLEIYEYTPLQIKMALTGNGRADKAAVKQMVLRICNMDKIPGPDDAVDAVAVALTHSHASPELIA